MENKEYEKLYDEIDNVCDKINNFLMGHWEKTGNFDFYMKTLQDAASNLRNVAHGVEEHLAWDK